MRSFSIALLLVWLAGCGGAEVKRETPLEPRVENSDQAIEIIRASFDAMGGIERLRLTSSNASIRATATAEGKTIPVEITVGGPERWRIDYLDDDVSYIYVVGVCRKIIYGIPARCTPLEESWIDPTRLLVGLVFPSSDAANLKASFRHRGEETINGAACDIVEIKARNSNLKMRAMYDRQTKLMARISFDIKNEASDLKTAWTADIGDWREVDKTKVPFKRIIRRGNETVWEETADSIELSSDSRKFDPPIPVTTDQPLSAIIPARRIVHDKIDGRQVEIPAPYPTLGGGPGLTGDAKNLPPIEAMRMVFKGDIRTAVGLKESLKSGIVSAGREAAGEPGIILLEQSQAADEPALMVLYVPLKPEKE
ncbi:MAG: hypothetical protein GY854_15720 [Deltaproteobacteria bacterium]|nr:hypothetical protein [Deltaproteobacteria bacterium]